MKYTNLIELSCRMLQEYKNRPSGIFKQGKFYSLFSSPSLRSLSRQRKKDSKDSFTGMCESKFVTDLDQLSLYIYNCRKSFTIYGARLLVADGRSKLKSKSKIAK